MLIVGFVGGDIRKVPMNLILLKATGRWRLRGAFSGRFPAENQQNFVEIIDMFKR